jgi:hypothetical protein
MTGQSLPVVEGAVLTASRIALLSEASRAPEFDRERDDAVGDLSSVTQAVGLGRGALFSSGEQRSFRPSPGQVGLGVEELQESIAALVHQRQWMRTSGASQASLERNRLQLVRSQWQLAHALVERHLPTRPEKSR